MQIIFHFKNRLSSSYIKHIVRLYRVTLSTVT